MLVQHWYMLHHHTARYPYDVTLNVEDGWDVIDVRTLKTISLNDLPQERLPASVADEVADLLNELHRIPPGQRH